MKKSDERKFFYDNDYTITEKYIREGYTFGMHWHNVYEIEIIFSGKGKHIINNKEYELKRGEAFFITRLDSHSITSIEDMYVRSFTFKDNLLPNSIAEFFSWRNGLQCSIDDETLKQVLIITEKLKHIDPQNPFAHEQKSNLITSLVLMLCDDIKNTSSEMSNLVQKTMAYISENFKENISLESAAKNFFITPKHLGAVIKKNTGMSFHSYLNITRLNFASSLLLNSSHSIKEIAFMSGYNSVDHFIYTFKKYFAITPLMYKKNPNQYPYPYHFMTKNQ
ncbi:MAG: helix-turn-helix domain-containing protein [Ruminococcaceae bacterium]|nr:helix-turn-helix domain-containing protein [Oscillospiraceae bacterium]